MRLYYATIATLLALLGTGLLSAEIRSWTSADGKVVKGEYVDTEDESVILLIKGKEKRIRISKLSEEDQEFIKQQQEKGGKHQVNKNFTAKWPGSTVMEDKLRARMVKEDEETGEFIYETAHFRFHSPAQLALQTVSEMGRVFEGTYTACRMIPLNFPCRRFSINKEVDETQQGESDDGEEKMVARLFLTKADYDREVGPGMAGSAGLYRTPEILVPFESLGIVKRGRTYSKAAGSKLETGTLIHELTHQMSLLGATYEVPIWFAEGVAEYARLATYKSGRFNFKGVKGNIKPYIIGGSGTSGRQLGSSFSAPSLESFLNMPTQEFQAAQGKQIQFNYGFSALLFYYFAHLDGKGDAARLKRWMRELQETQRMGVRVRANATQAEIQAARQQLRNMKADYHYDKLLDGREWSEVEEEFTKKVKKNLGIEVEFQ